MVQIPNILGDLEPFNAVGTVAFELNGSRQTMEAWRSGQRIWFVFRDWTSGRETYPSARFLYTDAPVDNQVVMDFNYAQNPPCAYNPFTTCPLPPSQNRLAIAIEAGESGTREKGRGRRTKEERRTKDEELERGNDERERRTNEPSFLCSSFLIVCPPQCPPPSSHTSPSPSSSRSRRVRRPRWSPECAAWRVGGGADGGGGGGDR